MLTLDKAGDTELESAYASLASSIVIYAHIHRPYVRQLGSMTVANTGSVSLSYDGDRRASYVVLDGHDASIRRVDYDYESEANELRQTGIPHAQWLCNILRAGRYCAPE
jgi:predicted phosphodiesterase